MKKIIIGFGTRPEFIKLMPVIRELNTGKYGAFPVLLHTGQQDILPMVNEFLEKEKNTIPLATIPAYNIESKHYLMIRESRMMFAISNAVSHIVNVSMIMVQGDTLSAYCLAKYGYLNNIPVYHVEAGLRSYDKYNPFPEEYYRISIDAIATINAPVDEQGVETIRQTNPSSLVRQFGYGNTVVDALQYFYPGKATVTYDIIITLHRREFWQGDYQSLLHQIVWASREAITKGITVGFVYHTNPDITNKAKEFFSAQPNPIYFIDPLPYSEFIYLISSARLIFTDSGGIQEEAPAIGVPFLIARKTTERRIEGFEDYLDPTGEKLMKAIQHPSDLQQIAIDQREKVFVPLCETTTTTTELICNDVYNYFV